jgi:hypothetical protein
MARKVMVIVILLVLTAAFLGGQAMSAQILGSVKNEQGEYLSGVEVTITNLWNNAVTTATTAKKKGRFRILALLPGVYQVSVDLEGYQFFVVSRVRLNAEQSFNLNIVLKKKVEGDLAG